MKRRHFIQNAALASAGTLAANTMLAREQEKTENSNKTIGYAVLGLGSFASYVAPRIAHSEKSRITALISSDGAKAKEWAARYGVPESSIYTYDNLEAIQNNSWIDAVYVATPVGTHADFAHQVFKSGQACADRKNHGRHSGPGGEHDQSGRASRKKINGRLPRPVRSI